VWIQPASANIRASRKRAENCGYRNRNRVRNPQSTRCLRTAAHVILDSIWLLDVKPGNAFRIDGFDLSLQQCPPAELCPEGCSIRQLDILGEIPEDLENIYDVVNVRLIQGALKEDPVPALKNMMAMLSMFFLCELQTPLN
jgi:hypothetical protein